jgi:hypothetical protein
LKEVPKFSDKIFAIIKDKNEITAIFREGANLQTVSEEKFFRLITFDVKLPLDLTGFLSYVSLSWQMKVYQFLQFLLILPITYSLRRSIWIRQ